MDGRFFDSDFQSGEQGDSDKGGSANEHVNGRRVYHAGDSVAAEHGKKITKYLIFSLIALTILFFVPWFSSDIDNALLDSTNIITGIQVSKYSDMLGELAGDSLGRLVALGLAIVKYSYVLPILALSSILMLFVHKRAGSLLSILTAFLHILIPVIFAFLPASIAEFVSLMFVITPTIFLFGVIGAINLVLSVILFLTEGRHRPRQRPKEKKSPKKSTLPTYSDDSDNAVKDAKKRPSKANAKTKEKGVPEKKKKIISSRK